MLTRFYTMIRLQKEDKWSRVRFAAVRVRYLGISQHPSSERINSMLRNYPEPMAALFPKLRHLSILEGSITRQHHSLFTLPTLREVHLTDDIGGTMTEPLVILHSASKVRDIRELSIRACWNDCSASISGIVLRQTRLENIEVSSYMSEQALIHLAQTPSLENLAAEFRSDEYSGILKASPANFARLTDLCLHAVDRSDNVAALTSFLGVFTPSSPLQWLTLYFVSSPTDTSLPIFFTAISGFRSLAYCQLELSSLSVGSDGGPVSTDVLEPLYRIRGMVELNLALLPMDISFDAVHKIAASWPNIQRLQLGQETRKSTSSLALEDIAPLVNNCPRLTFFATIFLSEAQRGSVTPSLGCRQRRITVDVGFSKLHLQDAPRMTAFYARLVPAGMLIVRHIPFEGVLDEAEKETVATTIQIRRECAVLLEKLKSHEL